MKMLTGIVVCEFSSVDHLRVREIAAMPSNQVSKGLPGNRRRKKQDGVEDGRRGAEG